jgi:hypothetical protein
MIEVAGEGIAESPAGGCEVVAGKGGGVGGRHDARVADQRPVGRVGLGREHVEADAGEVPGIEVGEGGVGVEEAAAGDVDEPGAPAPTMQPWPTTSITARPARLAGQYCNISDQA